MMVRLLPEDDWDFSGTPDEKEVTFMMDVAARVSGESHDYKTKVGAVIAKDRNILAYGYNGTVTGLDNTMRDKEGICLDTVVHAEQNAIAKLARSTQSGVGATAYCTLFPCMSCALSLVQAGISTIIYRDDHKGNKATDLLLDSNIQLFKYFKEQ
jgi:dCMP deaminase